MVLAVRPSQTWSYDLVREGADAGHVGYLDYWQHAEDRYTRSRTWLASSVDLLLRAVLGG